MSNEYMENLNNNQKEAVTTTEGYIRVIAGAGSGKTKALVSRYCYLVDNLGISTSNILSVTFTNKAAREMKKRIRTTLGDNDTGLVCTFHGFCRQLLKEDIHSIDYPDNFVLMDNDDMDSILKIVYEQARISSNEVTYKKAMEMITIRKVCKFEHIPYFVDTDNDKLKEKFLNSKSADDKVFFGYLYQQKKNYSLDFNDLITVALHILDNFPQIKLKWQKRLQYIMVDEFQDVNSLQYALVTILSGYHNNLFIVGDPDQTIYSWRGARIDFILNFDKSFENVKTIMMNTNYRSSQNIINASNSLISKNINRIEKELNATKLNSIPVTYYHAKTIYNEADWIVNNIKKIIQDKGNSYKDISILYRAHYISRSLEEAFLKNKIPYILYSGVEFYQRKEIKDVLSYLRMIVSEDDLSFLRVINEPKRNFGKKRIEIISQYAEANNCSLYNSLKINLGENLILSSKANEFVDLIEKYKKIYKEMTITDLLMEVLNTSGYESMLRTSGDDQRLDNLSELKNSIYDFENSAGENTSLEEYLQQIALYTNVDLEDKKDNVKMMTVHAAKGLEFPYVFVCSLNEGIFPSNKTDTYEKMEEERRLAYVAYTRAQKTLYLSDAEGTNYDNSFRYPSRFIFNTEKKHLDYIVELEEELVDDAENQISISETKLYNKSNILYKKGDKVKHNEFGVGIILDIDRDNSSYIIKFDKFKTNRNISFTIKLDTVDEEKVALEKRTVADKIISLDNNGTPNNFNDKEINNVCIKQLEDEKYIDSIVKKKLQSEKNLMQNNFEKSLQDEKLKIKKEADNKLKIAKNKIEEQYEKDLIAIKEQYEKGFNENQIKIENKFKCEAKKELELLKKSIVELECLNNEQLKTNQNKILTIHQKIGMIQDINIEMQKQNKIIEINQHKFLGNGAKLKKISKDKLLELHSKLDSILIEVKKEIDINNLIE